MVATQRCDVPPAAESFLLRLVRCASLILKRGTERNRQGPFRDRHFVMHNLSVSRLQLKFRFGRCRRKHPPRRLLKEAGFIQNHLDSCRGQGSGQGRGWSQLQTQGNVGIYSPGAGWESVGGKLLRSIGSQWGLWLH